MKSVKTLYCDGGIVWDGSPGGSSIGGTWAFVGVDDNDNVVIEKSGIHKTSGRETTNNHTEYIAAVLALEAMEEGWSGTLASDSQTTLGRLFHGWKNKNLPPGYVERAIAALDRLGTIKPLHLDGHATKAQLKAGIGKNGNPVSKWQVRCDKLCNEAKSLYNLEPEQEEKLITNNSVEEDLPF